MHEGDEKCMHNSSKKTLRGRDHLDDLDMGGAITLEMGI